MVRAGTVVAAKQVSAIFALVAVVPIFSAGPLLSNLVVLLRLIFAFRLFQLPVALLVAALFVVHRRIPLRAHEAALRVAYLLVGVFYKKQSYK